MAQKSASRMQHYWCHWCPVIGVYHACLWCLLSSSIDAQESVKTDAFLGFHSSGLQTINIPFWAFFELCISTLFLWSVTSFNTHASACARDFSLTFLYSSILAYMILLYPILFLYMTTWSAEANNLKKREIKKLWQQTFTKVCNLFFLHIIFIFILFLYLYYFPYYII